MAPDDPRHGTRAGYDAHLADGEEACAPCRAGAARYENELLRDHAAGVRRTVPAVGTARRVQALVAIGYTYGQIGAALGVSHDGPQKLARATDTVRRSTAARVAALYAEWAMRPAPDGRSAAYARTMAKKNGWVSPLAWDDDAIDDPQARPVGVLRDWMGVSRDDVDPVVVERVMSGKPVARATYAERREVVARWTAAGRSLKALEDLTGWKTDRYRTSTTPDAEREAS